MGDASRHGRPALPRLALIADGFTEAAVAERAAEAVRAGVPWVHLRDHDASEEDFRPAARALAEQLRRASPGVLLSVNSRLAVARELNAALHTGRHGPAVEEARRSLASDALVGVSAHAPNGDVRPDTDYFFFSPVFPTTSKPGHPGTGLEALAAFCQSCSGTPVLALGGLTPARVGPCLRAGTHGVAVLSGILHADDPADATRRYLDTLPDL